MYRVLAAIDEDEGQATEIAASIEALAENVPELEVVVAHVFRDVDIPAQVVIHEQLGDFDDVHREQREVPAAVLNVVDRLKNRRIDAEILVESGEDPAERIIALAEERDVDNIFIGGRSSSPVGKALFGSVAQQVILNTDIPVTVASVPK